MAGIVFTAGVRASKPEPDAGSVRRHDQSAIAVADVQGLDPAAAQASKPGVVEVPGLYIVQLADPPVAQYRGGEPSIEPLPRLRHRGGRIDVRSPQALGYADLLAQRQHQFLAEVQNASGRPVFAVQSYQFAFNGFVARFEPAQLEYSRAHPDVRLIEPVAMLPIHTDAGPGFIGAPAIWNGTATAEEPGTSGEGIVIGVIDSGVNWESPSFADIGGDGFDHANPLGANNYLGVCASQPVDPDVGPNCNDKLIGAYAKSFDFVQQVNFECANPDHPDNELGLSPGVCSSLGVPLRDYANALDENGHGSHTASTAGGNVANIDYLGNIVSVSGVAPHANLVVYDACHTITTGPNAGRGSCFNFATLAAIEQVIEDGIVDVVNYSIGGGTSPWTEANSLAFLSAVDAGVFVAASAGNSGPGAGTMGHVEPWVATSGASSHSRGPYNFRFSANGDVNPPPQVTSQPIFLGTVGGPHDAAYVDTPLVISPEIGLADDGCDAYDPGAFTGAVAVIRRGGCAFATKVLNAEAAGATGVIIANNTGGNIAPGVAPSVPFAVFGATQAQGDALRDYVASLADPATAVISIPLEAVADATQGDVMAAFSSRGPNNFDLLKPDVTNPGVNILAAYTGADPSTPEGASATDGYGVISGTSMSSPHTAGSAALIRAVHPDWTVAEVKSALMLTANRGGITKEDGLSPSDPFDRGAGRVNLGRAAEAGLVMDEQPLEMFLADPANGGDPTSLNLPSLSQRECVGTCSWSRRLRSVYSGPVTYQTSFEVPVDVAVTVTPDQFTVLPGQSVVLDIEADVSAATAEQFHFGHVVLTPSPPMQHTETVTPQMPVDIPDDGYTGGFGGMSQACIDLDTSGDLFGIVGDVSLGVTMSHTYVGDLVLKLRSPGGTVLGLMSRPGFNELADDGGDPIGGFPGWLDSQFPITFSDGAGVAAEAMGSTLFPTEVVCQQDNECDFTPSPGSIQQPPSDLAGFFGENPEGLWTLCVGDAQGQDVGSITSASLTVNTADVPTLHIPLAVFPLDAVPDIAIDPQQVAITVTEGDGPQLFPVSIANEGLATLNWAQDEIVQIASDPLYTQLLTLEENPGNGFGTGFYDAVSGIFLSDSFTLDAPADIGALYADGFVFAPTPDQAYQEVSFFVFPDAGGAPAGDPQTSPELAVFNHTALIGTAGLTVQEGPFAGSIRLDLPAAGVALNLDAGKYWLVVAPGEQGFGGDANDEWFWMGSGPNLNQDDVALIIDPSDRFGFGLTEWAALEPLLAAPIFRGLSFEVSAAADCGAPWLASAPVNGSVAAGASQLVTLTLDPTGLTPGVYEALYCVASNDPEAPLVSVPVTLTVDPKPADPIVVGAAAPAELDIGQTTLITATVTPGSDPASTGLGVTADLRSIGGSAVQALYDDGTNGDAHAGDLVFSVSFAVQPGTPYGPTTVSVTVDDDQGRSDSDDVGLLVRAVGDDIFSDGFED